APPRIGSATGSPRRSLSRAINARASASASALVLKLTPAARIAGLVREPRRIVSSTISSTLGTANSSSPSRQVRIGSWQTTNTSGWLPCSRTEDFRGSGGEIGDDGVHRNSCAGDHDSGLAACPEVGVDAARFECAGDAERSIFLSKRAVGSDGQEPLAA